jgi:H/ACA ribonucleoprotein complex subunit 3
MKSDIHVCSDWRAVHDRPVYTLGDECPECGAEAINSAPAPFSPEDNYGEYRRRAKRRRGKLPPRAGEDGGE